MEKIKFDSGIKRYAFENENNKIVAELLINTRDNSLYDKFLDLMEGIRSIKEKSKQKIQKISPDSEKSINEEQMRKMLLLNKEAIEGLIEETEKMFGQGLIRKIYADNYALNPGFLPSIDSLFEFYEQILPIMEKLFRQKHTKYSPKNRGKANG